VVFFLGRLAWQGVMAGCVDALAAIASNPRRGVHARRVSARAVAAVSEVGRRKVWRSLIAQRRGFPALECRLSDRAPMTAIGAFETATFGRSSPFGGISQLCDPLFACLHDESSKPFSAR